MSSVLLCLHGWGGSKESFTELRAALADAPITVLTPDLPGFGDEPDPDRPWTTNDYADWVESWLKNHHSTLITQHSSFSLLGHSHGGRIALKLAARQSTNNEQRSTNNVKIHHLHLCAAAGIYHPRRLRRAIGFLLSKIGKLLLTIPGIHALKPLAKKALYRLLRVHDYERASSVMRETFRLVRKEDLTPLLSTITIPTDIFWGTNDTMTPISDAHLMHQKIIGSTLHEFPAVRHRVHRDKATEIANVIRSQITC